MLLDAFVAKFRVATSVTDSQVGAWWGPVRSSARRALGKSNYQDADFDIDHYQVGHWHWITAKVGYVTRSRLYDSHWRQISLPGDMRWNDPWRPVPTELKYGYILADETSTFAEGNTVPERLEWLKVRDRSARLVKRFDAETCLEDDFPVRVLHGSEVRFRIKDEPMTFAVTGADPSFTRYLTWNCTPKGIKLVRSEPKDPEVRFIDRQIAIARSAKRRNALQRKIVKLWPPGRELTEWSEKPPKDGSIRVSFDNEIGFVLSGRPGSYRLLRIGEDRSFKQEWHE
jgi:hypothetical protein